MKFFKFYYWIVFYYWILLIYYSIIFRNVVSLWINSEIKLRISCREVRHSVTNKHWRYINFYCYANVEAFLVFQSWMCCLSDTSHKCRTIPRRLLINSYLMRGSAEHFRVVDHALNKRHTSDVVWCRLIWYPFGGNCTKPERRNSATSVAYYRYSWRHRCSEGLIFANVCRSYTD